MVKIYYDKDANLSILKDRIIAVIGYGHMGEAQALNIRDSGLNVVVGNISDAYAEAAKKAGFKVYPIEKATETGDVLLIYLPDEVQPTVYEEKIKHKLEEGKALVFASGFNIHFGFIEPPAFVDVVLLAPAASVEALRNYYLEGSGVPVLVGVHQDYSGQAKEINLALAKAIGATRVGAIDSSFKEEAEIDLFSEVAGGALVITHLINTWHVMVKEGGFSPEAAYISTFYELADLLEQIRSSGLKESLPTWSNTARYLMYRYGSNVLGREYWEGIRKNLRLVKVGDVARDWMLEGSVGSPVLKRYMEEFFKHPINEVSEFFAKITKKQEARKS